MRRLLKRFIHFLSDERGDGGLESAIVTPLFLTMAMMAAAIAVGGWERLIAAGVTPLVARAASVAGGQLSQYQSLVPGGPADVMLGAPDCARNARSHLYRGNTVDMPLVPDLTVHLRGGSETRWWKFWAGPPTDGCN
jgi:hypothetical protein